MWKSTHRALFDACLAGLENDDAVMSMRDIPQHVKGVSCYDHCMFVSYLSFTFCRMLGLDYRAAARAGLLHDLYLQHWEDTDVGRFERLWLHPHLALQNAKVFDLSDKEADIIVKHMWPLTRPLPAFKESYLVSAADKIAATLEMAHLFRVLGIRKNILLLGAPQLLPAWYC
ncbi:MAG: HDIG domain-containing protein [Ruthenibacterium sp.]